MKPIDKLFTTIVTEHLGMATLTARNSDSLDFHNIAVWQVEAALKAAFNLGSGHPPRTPDFAV
jgi:hypothetical protein